MSSMHMVMRTIAETAATLAQCGFAEGGAGNISFRLPGTGHTSGRRIIEFPAAYPALGGRTLLVTATGSRMRQIARHPSRWLIPVTFASDGRCATMPESRLQPTGELLMHAAIHEALIAAGMNDRAVLHAHPPLCPLLHSIFPAESLPALLRRAHTECPMVLPRGVAVLPLLAPGSPELASAVATALTSHDTAIMADHGVVTTARSLSQALDKMEVAEKAALCLLVKRVCGAKNDCSPWPDKLEALYLRLRAPHK
ncbi:MAG: class II aldolase/adducin family protein [Candidatus Brocadiia bacterium]